MPKYSNATGFLLLNMLLAFCPTVQGQEDVADVPSQVIQLKKHPLEYVVIGGSKNATTATQPRKLLVVLPGGDGSVEFLPFVKRIKKHALSEEYLVLQLIAPKWNQQQRIVWPTARDSVRGKKMAVEEYLELAVADLGKEHDIEKKHVYTLSWSSGGPAAYAASLRKDTPITGSLVAMSVFKPKQLPAIRRAKGQRYYILHSQQDRVCPYRMAVDARDTLAKYGAATLLVEYPGGHGWRGDLFGNIRQGIHWLENAATGDHPRGDKQKPSEAAR